MTPESSARMLHSQPMAADVSATAARLRAVIMLSGTVRTSPLHTTVKRSLMDLPLSLQSTLMHHWAQGIGSLAQKLGLTCLPWRLILSQGSAQPKTQVTDPSGRVPLSVEQDPSELRGTGGVLRDVTRDYADQDRVLMVAGPQVILAPLQDVLLPMLASPADVVVLTYADGTPSGLKLVRCGALRTIREVGFVDLKEQALPELAKTHRIQAFTCEHPATQPVRTLDSYLKAVRLHQKLVHLGHTHENPWEEDWSSPYAVLEAGAEVGARVTIQNSVILRGAVVEAGAVVVRSLVGPGGRVGRGQTVINQLVGGGRD